MLNVSGAAVARRRTLPDFKTEAHKTFPASRARCGPETIEYVPRPSGDNTIGSRAQTVPVFLGSSALNGSIPADWSPANGSGKMGVTQESWQMSTEPNCDNGTTFTGSGCTE